MSDSHGKFVWYELMTTDTAAAETFYKSVVGWSAKDSGMSDMSYTILSAGEHGVGGLMAIPERARNAGARPGWVGYVAVDDVDASAAQATRKGGTLHHGPEDIPGVGRFAVIGDPQHAVLTLFKPSPTMQDHPPPAPPATPGHTGWHELFTSDREAAFGFYADLFGWTKAEAMDMGPMGIYQIFARGDQPIGGMMTKPEEMPVSFWRYYFNVDNITAAVARVEAAGGQILLGPIEVPGGSWIINGSDPQGAQFALVGPKG
ncbi:MAG TPA: VOC family protein [Stellaceae bacterium]|nr:VOC family protein [Stellaceae bacterium]